MANTVNLQLQTNEFLDKIALQISESRAQRLRARELINQLQLMRKDTMQMRQMREDASRMRLSFWTSIEMLSEDYCGQFEMSEAAARDKSSLIDGYPGVSD